MAISAVADLAAGGGGGAGAELEINPDEAQPDYAQLDDGEQDDGGWADAENDLLKSVNAATPQNKNQVFNFAANSDYHPVDVRVKKPIPLEAPMIDQTGIGSMGDFDESTAPAG